MGHVEGIQTREEKSKCCWNSGKVDINSLTRYCLDSVVYAVAVDLLAHMLRGSSPGGQ